MVAGNCIDSSKAGFFTSYKFVVLSDKDCVISCAKAHLFLRAAYLHLRITIATNCNAAAATGAIRPPNVTDKSGTFFYELFERTAAEQH